MRDVDIELAILRCYVEHYDSVDRSAPKCARELDMRDVISDVTGTPANDSTVERWHARLAPGKRYPNGVLRPCSDSNVNNGPHRFHARAFYEPGREPAWERIRDLESQLPAPSPTGKEIRPRETASARADDPLKPEPPPMIRWIAWFFQYGWRYRKIVGLAILVVVILAIVRAGFIPFRSSSDDGPVAQDTLDVSITPLHVLAAPDAYPRSILPPAGWELGLADSVEVESSARGMRWRVVLMPWDDLNKRISALVDGERAVLSSVELADILWLSGRIDSVVADTIFVSEGTVRLPTPQRASPFRTDTVF